VDQDQAIAQLQLLALQLVAAGRLIEDLAPEVFAGSDHRPAGDIGAARGIGSGIIGRDIGVRHDGGDIAQARGEDLSRHLSQDGIGAGTDIGRAHQQGKIATFIELDLDIGHIDIFDSGALHGDRHASGPDFAIRQNFTPRGLVPANQLLALDQAAVEGTAQDMLVVGDRFFPLADDIEKTQLDWIDTKGVGQLIDDRLDKESALGRAVAPEGPGRHFMGIDDFGRKTGMLKLIIQGQRFFTDQAEGRPAMQAIGTLVREDIDGQGPDRAVAIRAEPDGAPHRMAAVRGHIGLLAGIDDFGRLAGFQGDDGRKNLRNRGLLGPKATPDPGLDHTDPAGGQAKGEGKLALDVEGDLGRGNHNQAVPLVEVGIAAEGLHHRLGLGLGLVGPFQHDVARVKNRGIVRPEGIVMGSDNIVGDVRQPDTVRQVEDQMVRLMDQGFALEGLIDRQNSRQDLIIDLDQAQGHQGGALGLGSNNRHLIAGIADLAVKDQAVIGGWLGIGLAGQREPRLGHILPGQDQLDAGHFFRFAGVDAADAGMGMR